MAYDIRDAKCFREKVVNGEVTALLVDAPDLDGPTWFPYAQVDDDSEVYRKGDAGTFIISDWLAKERGFL